MECHDIHPSLNVVRSWLIHNNFALWVSLLTSVWPVQVVSSILHRRHLLNRRISTSCYVIAMFSMLILAKYHHWSRLKSWWQMKISPKKFKQHWLGTAFDCINSFTSANRRLFSFLLRLALSDEMIFLITKRTQCISTFLNQSIVLRGIDGVCLQVELHHQGT